MVKGQSIANCYIANYSIEKLQAIAKFSVKLSQYVHCKILAQTREQSYIVNYSIKCRKRLQYLRSNYCNPCIAHYFANYRKLLPNLLPNYRIAHRTLFCQLSQTFAISSAKLSQSVHCTLFCQLSQTVAKPSVKLSQFVHRTLFCQLSQTVAKPLSNYRIAHRTLSTTALIDYVIETGCG